jgi:hypothetical protein
MERKVTKHNAATSTFTALRLCSSGVLAFPFVVDTARASDCGLQCACGYTDGRYVTGCLLRESSERVILA